jgi:hypothetical protein
MLYEVIIAHVIFLGDRMTTIQLDPIWSYDFAKWDAISTNGCYICFHLSISLFYINIYYSFYLNYKN